MWQLAPGLSALAASLLFLGLSVLALFLERKFIAIAQKRLGISFLGRNGWAHLPADLVKFWLKFTGRHQGHWGGAGVGLTGTVLAYLTWTLLSPLFFLGGGRACPVDFWDFQLVAYFAYANLGSLLMFSVAAATRSKYATLAGLRVLLVCVFTEVFFTLCFLALYAHAGDFSFAGQGRAPLVFALPPLACWLLLYALVEAKRPPFDHSEAESELVAGHMVELGGRTLLFFYVSEYAHLVFCVFLVLTLCLGGGNPSFHVWAAAPATLALV